MNWSAAVVATVRLLEDDGWAIEVLPRDRVPRGVARTRKRHLPILKLVKGRRRRPLNPRTLNAMQRHGFIECIFTRAGQVWRVTPAGRALLRSL